MLADGIYDMITKFASVTCLMLYFSLGWGAENISLKGEGRSSIEFSSWDQYRAVWKYAIFSKGDLSYDLYDSNTNTSSISVGVAEGSRSVSPGNKYALIMRTVFGELDDGQKVVSAEKSYCDMISMDTGCVLLTRHAEACVGGWEGDSWSIRGGGVIQPILETPSPEKILKSVAGLSNSSYKALVIMDDVFMGVESYLSCHAPDKNVTALNDLGFYLAEGGYDSSALKIYKSIEPLGARTVLMLNIADSLWQLKRNAEAIEYYRKYKDLMSAEQKDSRIPIRVFERIE